MAADADAGDAIVDLNCPRAPGTAVFLGALIAGALLACESAACCICSAARWCRLVPSLLAISFMVGLAFVTRYSGMDTVLGLSLTRHRLGCSRSSGRCSGGWAWR